MPFKDPKAKMDAQRRWEEKNPGKVQQYRDAFNKRRQEERAMNRKPVHHDPKGVAARLLAKVELIARPTKYGYTGRLNLSGL